MKVGIDLGTTYSVVAKYDTKTARAEIIRNKYLKDLTPSVVYFMDDGTAIIGEDAKEMQKGGAGNIAAVFKVNMGTKEICADVKGRKYKAEELSKILLNGIVREAEGTSGEKIESAVITVPAYFDDLQRKSTRSAAESAGIHVTKILNEPTAAAIYYGYKHYDGKTILVYDLGGGTFDVTVVKVNNGSIEVKGTKGNHSLGGKDWDEALMNIACERFLDQYGIDPRDDSRKVFELLADAEDYKKLLSKMNSITFTMSYEGHVGRYDISKEDFESCTDYLVESTRDVIRDLLNQIKICVDDVDEVLLCGGSTRLPRVTESLKEYGFKKIVSHRDTDLAVAKGAAIVAALYSNEETAISDLKVSDVAAHSLGVLSIDPICGRYTNDIMISSNTPVPVSVTKPFRIEEGNMTDQIEVFMMQGESPVPEDCTVVKRNIITGLENNGKGMVIDITYSYDDEGTVVVTASRNGKTLPVIDETIPDDLDWMSREPQARSSNKRVAKNVAICVDLSRSMKDSLEEVKAAIRSFVTSLSGEFTKFCLIGFGDKAKMLCDMTLDDDEILEDVESLKLNTLGRGTDASPLPLIRDVMAEENGAKFALILTDGVWGNRDIAVEDARACRDEMINIVAIGFGKADKSFLKQIATIEEGAMYITLSKLGKTINTIATAINDCPTGIMEIFR